MIIATMTCAPISALGAALRSTRPTRCRAGTKRRNGSLTALAIGSTAAHGQSHRGLECAVRLGRICARLGIGVDVAAGDVERRKGGVRVLRQAAPTGLDQARYQTNTCRRGGPTQEG